jgi:4-amino-4-deoxy-L-arabinose transferase-like glycosyltransferase
VSQPNGYTPIYWPLLLGLALATLGLHVLSSGPLAYGYMSDELYYLDSTARLAWGYVDHPPLSIAILKLVRAVLGDSLPALRLLPALAAAATVVLVGLLARELGGGRTAQGLAGLAAAVCPVYLGLTSFYSMNAIELAMWGLAALLVARIVNTGSARLWIALGFVLGLGLLNKISMSWFGIGLGVGLVLTSERRWLATPGPWVSAGIALLLFLPHVVWQVENGWPTLEFVRNATEYKMVSKSPATFAAEQFVIMHPLLAPFWLAGLAYYFLVPAGRSHRIQGWIWLSVFFLLMFNDASRANYLAPAYTSLLAGGGVVFERAARGQRWRWLPAAAAAVITLGGLVTAPLALPLLPPEQYAGYERTLGISAPVEEQTEFGEMPLHYALRFGWTELLAALEKAHATLTPAEQEQAVVFGSWFGDTGAVNFFGPERGLPRAIGGHNNYWLWGPGDASGKVVLMIDDDAEGLREIFERVERVAEVDCRYCMPDVNRLAVFVARGIKRPIAEVWPELKHYR